MNLGFSILIILGTITIYFLAKKFYKRFPFPFFVPIATSTCFIVGILLLTNNSYSQYMQGGKYIELLLGPAVVAMAFPLYEHRNTLKRHAFAIVASVMSGALIGLLSGIYLSLWLEVDEKLIRSLAPKSVTSPVAMDISSLVHGIPSLAAVYVMIAGISGVVFGPSLLRLVGIKDPIAVGIGYGAAAHGVGMAKALEIGNQQGAISSISMILSAVFASIFGPIIIGLIL
ncbi:LrgB family protein [Metabacillus arenae]|uniref:LrgB family protein n=1 Tax=Metabacillus arenae TaxID=2771434 RepID=A0A926NF98_9BACI|nr:LrgB family protein [Metabacillus arenae]MBD1380186.1 LrgB family protein [Metabacillus arenae]